MEGMLDKYELELYKVALLEALCIHHGITREQMKSFENIIKEDNK